MLQLGQKVSFWRQNKYRCKLTNLEDAILSRRSSPGIPALTHNIITQLWLGFSSALSDEADVAVAVGEQEVPLDALEGGERGEGDACWDDDDVVQVDLRGDWDVHGESWTAGRVPRVDWRPCDVGWQERVDCWKQTRKK